ncbi:MAG: hypothetical protein KatS3mg113_1104 [Planctomycetaceae bacterium]|nr:MAG: hypothetical protein KatS3mg113_1104 [Planctomycetaceae bacterium]
MGGRRRGFAAHNRSWVWGRHAVGETLQAQRWQPLEVRLSPRCPAALRQRLLHLCQQRSIPSSVVSDEELTQLCKTEEHQGVAMRLPPFPYANFSEQLTRRPPVWLVLDGIQDAYNYGAILRSAETLGITTVLVGERGQCEVNSLVVRSSAGAVNHLALVRVSDLTEAVRALRAEGYCVLAATEKGGIPVYPRRAACAHRIHLGERRGGYSQGTARAQFSTRVHTSGRESLVLERSSGRWDLLL